jgi:putative transposase
VRTTASLRSNYPFHDRTIAVTLSGRVCFGSRRINRSTVFAGQNVGVKEVDEKVWLISFMNYDLFVLDPRQSVER